MSLPGREPSHSADAVALLTQQSASSTLKARPAKLYRAAANVDREDNHAPGSSPQRNYRLDAPAAIRQPHLLWAAILAKERVIRIIELLVVSSSQTADIYGYIKDVSFVCGHPAIKVLCVVLCSRCYRDCRKGVVEKIDGFCPR